MSNPLLPSGADTINQAVDQLKAPEPEPDAAEDSGDDGPDTIHAEIPVTDSTSVTLDTDGETEVVVGVKVTF